MHIGIGSAIATPFRGGGPITVPDNPSVALFLDGEGGWLVRDGNTDTPTGFVVTRDAGTTFVIDQDAESGLTLTVVDGRPKVTYP